VRRLACFLVVVVLLQLSGLRAVCVPPPERPHPCCPIGEKPTLPNRSSLPDCCLISVLNYQGSISEVQSSDRYSELTAELGRVSLPCPVPLEVSGAPERQVSLPSVSPPLSPLQQSCLLLV